MTDLTKLADELDAVNDACGSRSIREAARILRSAAGVDVDGLMALFDDVTAVQAELYVRPTAERKDRRDKARAALESALRMALAAREGFVMVPVEPTPEMLNAFYDAEYQDDGGDSKFSQAYRAMIAAAPKGTPDHPADAIKGAMK